MTVRKRNKQPLQGDQRDDSRNDSPPSTPVQTHSDPQRTKNMKTPSVRPAGARRPFILIISVFSLLVLILLGNTTIRPRYALVRFPEFVLSLFEAWIGTSQWESEGLGVNQDNVIDLSADIPKRDAIVGAFKVRGDLLSRFRRP